MLILCVFVNRFGLDCNEVPETRPFLSLLHLYFTPSTPDLVQLGLYIPGGGMVTCLPVLTVLHTEVQAE
jgi:hypothetical protein